MTRRQLLVSLLCCATLLVASVAQALTLDDVKQMHQVGVPDSIIISTIESAEETFNLGAQDIIDLKKAGISDAVIEALQSTAGNVTRTAPGRRDTQAPKQPDTSQPDSRSGSQQADEDDDGSMIRRRRGGDSRRRAVPEEEDEDDSLIRRRGRDKKTTKKPSSSAKVQRTPKKIKSAIANYKEKKFLTASLKLYRLAESGKYPEFEAKINYYLGGSLEKIGLLHSAQYYFQEVVKEGPSTGALFAPSLAKMVSISDKTKDPIYLIRTIDKISPRTTRAR